jgi:hypothetical protein
MDVRIMPYIVLHHKMSGDRFFTSYDGDYNKYEKFEILGFANSTHEARAILHPTRDSRNLDLLIWYNKLMSDMESKGLGLSKEGKQQGLETLLNARD